MRSNFCPLDFTAEVRYNISTRKVVWCCDHILLIYKLVASLKKLLVFTTTFHPTERNGVGGNSGDKMLKDDGFSEQKPLYVVKTTKRYLYIAIRDVGAAGSNLVTSTKNPCFHYERHGFSFALFFG